MSTKEQKFFRATGQDRKNSLPTSRTSILSKTLSTSSQSSHKGVCGGGDPQIEEIFSTPLGFLHAIYKLQLQRDASFLGKIIELRKNIASIIRLKYLFLIVNIIKF